MILYDLILPMDFNIDTATTDDLPEILELNEAALPAVSSVNLVDMEHFLSIAEYFRILKIKDQIIGFLIALTPGRITKVSIISGSRKNINHLCM